MVAFVVVTVIFATGAMVQTIAGFGSALIIMPMLTQFMGIQAAASVLALAGAAVTVAVLYQNWQGLDWREAGLLLSGSVVGVPLGALALKFLPAAPVMGFLGIALLAYAVYSILAARRTGTETPRFERAGRGTASRKVVTVSVGFCAGLLGGAYATDGPPLVVYGTFKRWSKESFRSILQACFLVDGVLIVACYGAGGLLTREVLIYSAYGIPGMAAGLVLGTMVDRRIDHALFHRVLPWLIMVLGAALVVRACFFG